MNRAKKCCAYRDCKTDSVNNTERTLFQFPKDEERASQWRLAGAVDPIEAGPHFMCDLHFSRKYMCFSARRKMLLSMAVPKPYGSADNEEESEQVQSSSLEQEQISTLELTVEEHLDETMLNESDSVTEILYIDQMDTEAESKTAEEQTRQKTSPQKRSMFDSIEKLPAAKVIKMNKIPYAARSTVVSSSTSTKALATYSPKPIAIPPPVGSVLRKVKLKKRFVEATKKSVLNDTIGKKEPQPSSKIHIEIIEPPVSISPEKLGISKQSPVKQIASPVATSSITHNSTESKMTSSKSPKKEAETTAAKNDSTYEFIFKGEEYIQLPKAQYYSEKKELEQRLNRSQDENTRLQKKLEYYRNMVKDLKEFLNALSEEEIE
ncbi:uncharacterized protein LOC131685378 [Topomyia yanbarensis]|uniref:uncharacterized protein LOC131685378 n=1 Tax=Topomyia yanbarensis TaxID=2498891 RepID=UPI00273CB075|nr:uncharacterized protein LOC131685378 [Topomyia yanbarensis]